MKLKILLTGKSGQIGSELLLLLPRVGEVIAPTRDDLDLLDSGSIRRFVRDLRPDLIVNAAAYTAVDASETNVDLAYAVNGNAPAVLAEEAKRAGAMLVHYSTDYVFDGLKTSPYKETDSVAPINVYGKSKLAGEKAIQASDAPHVIFRTAWVYSTHGRNFLLTILRLATEREELRVVRDQFGSPTWSREVAVCTVRILTQILEKRGATSGFSQASGIYHMTADGETTWYGFANAILQAVARVPKDASWLLAATGGKPLITRLIIPISSAEYATPASRPTYSILSNSLLLQEFGVALPDWRVQLDRCIALV